MPVKEKNTNRTTDILTFVHPKKIYLIPLDIDEGSTWVTLWLVTLVTLANHNVTSVQNDKKIL